MKFEKIGSWFLLSAMVMATFVVIWSAVRPGPPSVPFDNGTEMVIFADVVKASDGMTYRVTITDITKPGEEPSTIVDVYSADSKFAGIIASGKYQARSLWNQFETCSADQVVDFVSCEGNRRGESILNELVAKVATKKNLIGNFEIFWSWSLGTKELINNIKEKRIIARTSPRPQL